MDRKFKDKCLLCLNDCNKSISITSTQVGEVTLKVVMEQHFWFEITDIPKSVLCVNCFNHVDNFHTFYKTIEYIHFKDIDPEMKVETVDIVTKDEIEVDEREFEAEENESRFETEDNRVIDLDVHVQNVKIEQIDINDVSFNCLDQENLNSKCIKTQKPVKVNTKLVHEKKAPFRSTDNNVEIFERNKKALAKLFKMNCEECSEPFESFDNARKHYELIHKTKGYIVCCNRRFFEYTPIFTHLDYHNDPKAFQCPSCDRSYIDIIRLKMHIRRAHQNSESQMCDLCGTTCKTLSSYERHYKVFHTNELVKVQCDICSTWLKNKFGIRAHIRRQHLQSYCPQKCDLCGKETRNRRMLSNHMQYHHKYKLYTCNICDKTFKQPSWLKDHMTRHTGEVSHKCDYCSKTFQTRPYMYAHRKQAHPNEYKKAKVNGTKFDKQTKPSS